MKASVLRYAAIGMATISLAGFAAASTVTNTGKDSYNKAELKNKTKVHVNNTNAAGISNVNLQSAASGNVTADKHAEAEGDLTSGMSSNENVTSTVVEASNSSATAAAAAAFSGSESSEAEASVVETGVNSYNKAEVKNKKILKVDNINSVEVSNMNAQSATSGNVKAHENTSVGNLKSGDATNSSQTINEFTFTN